MCCHGEEQTRCSLSGEMHRSWCRLDAGLWARQIAEVSAAPFSAGPAQGLTLPDSPGGSVYSHFLSLQHSFSQMTAAPTTGLGTQLGPHGGNWIY